MRATGTWLHPLGGCYYTEVSGTCVAMYLPDLLSPVERRSWAPPLPQLSQDLAGGNLSGGATGSEARRMAAFPLFSAG